MNATTPYSFEPFAIGNTPPFYPQPVADEKIVQLQKIREITENTFTIYATELAIYRTKLSALTSEATSAYPGAKIIELRRLVGLYESLADGAKISLERIDAFINSPLAPTETPLFALPIRSSSSINPNQVVGAKRKKAEEKEPNIPVKRSREPSILAPRDDLNKFYSILKNADVVGTRVYYHPQGEEGRYATILGFKEKHIRIKLEDANEEIDVSQEQIYLVPEQGAKVLVRMNERGLNPNYYIVGTVKNYQFTQARHLLKLSIECEQLGGIKLFQISSLAGLLPDRDAIRAEMHLRTKNFCGSELKVYHFKRD